jgi:hypothetical protein
MKAEDLIKRASAATTLAPPSAKAMAELKKVLEHNDAARGNHRRVRAEDACELLRAHGWSGSSRTALDTLCQKVLGRRSFGTP